MIGLYQSFKISISFITPCMISFIANVQSREAYRQKVDFREGVGWGEWGWWLKGTGFLFESKVDRADGRTAL